MPVFNNSESFYYFFTWNLFTGQLGTEVTDISWDEGKTFLFRDQRIFFKDIEFNILNMFDLLKGKRINEMRHLYKDKLKQLCRCDEIYVYKMSGSMYEHLILKKNNTVIGKELL